MCQPVTGPNEVVKNAAYFLKTCKQQTTQSCMFKRTHNLVSSPDRFFPFLFGDGRKMVSGDETTHNRLYAVFTWPGTWLIQIHWIVWLFHLIMMIITAMKGEKWDLSVFLLLQNVKLCLRNVVGIKCLTIFIVEFYHAFLFH